MNSPSGRTELTLEDYLAILRRRWPWLLVPILVVATLAMVVGLRAAPQYSATAAVLLSDSAAQEALDSGNTNTGLLTRRIENEINFAKSDVTESLVEEKLGFLPDEQVSITGIDSADVLEFTALSPTPEEAAEWANVWAAAYVTTKQFEAEASITAAVGQLQDRLEILQAERTEVRLPLDELQDQLIAATDADRRAALQLRVDRMEDDLAPALQLIDVQIEQVVTNVGDLELSGEVAGAGTARVLQVASPPESDSGAPLWRTMLLGLVAGFVMGVSMALAAESFDKTIKTVDEIVAATGLPVLGSIPKPGKSSSFVELAVASRDHPESAVADGYQRVTNAFQFSLVGKDVKSVLVTSANQAEGKTTTSANLAYALATLDNRVALVDVDFRRPRLHKALGVQMEPGFSNHLIDGTPLVDMASYVDQDRMLALIPCGGLPPNPAEFVSVPEFGLALDSLEEVADLVILDGPPLLPVADSLSLARHADAVVITVLAGETRKDHLRRAVDSVTQVGASVLGCVLIGVKDDALYGTYRYYADETASSLGHVPKAVMPAPTRVPESSRQEQVPPLTPSDHQQPVPRPTVATSVSAVPEVE